MGQAKQRGTLAERLTQSVAEKRKKAEDLGLVRRDLSEIREEFDLPPDTPFHGYVIHSGQ